MTRCPCPFVVRLWRDVSCTLSGDCFYACCSAHGFTSRLPLRPEDPLRGLRSTRVGGEGGPSRGKALGCRGRKGGATSGARSGGRGSGSGAARVTPCRLERPCCARLLPFPLHPTQPSGHHLPLPSHPRQPHLILVWPHLAELRRSKQAPAYLQEPSCLESSRHRASYTRIMLDKA